MMSRPFGSMTIDEMRAYFNENIGSAENLAALKDELANHRTTRASKELHAAVNVVLDGLQAQLSNVRRPGEATLPAPPVSARGGVHNEMPDPNAKLRLIREALSKIAVKLRLTEEAPIDVMRIFAACIDELERRKIVRSINNPVSDYTEWLVAKKLKLNRAGNSNSGYDATDPQSGAKYQIKARRVFPKTSSIQLGALRNLKRCNFDFLVAVVFELDFTIRHAIKVPHAVVLEHLASFSTHTNSDIFIIRPSLLKLPGVEDIRSTLESST
jgi:hypothetical protein